ncbi:MAG: NAD-dependent epimerase, partial [Psychroserpens sp.]|nr:NAD-dependent epimerase [Psychroserpens sp.]
GGSSGSLFKIIHKGLKYYSTGTTGYIDVWDVSKIMVTLMTSDIVNERFILVAENLSFKSFQEFVSKTLNVPAAKKEITTFLLEIGWRLDWLNHKIFGKRRRLSKQMARTIQNKSFYDNSKIKSAIGFEFNPLETSIESISQLYLKDLNSN